MKKYILPISILLAGAVSSQAVIKEYADVTTVAVWDVDNAVEMNAGDESLDTNTTTPGLFETIYGDISGNTISRANFKTLVGLAKEAGLGGVVDFEDANWSFSANDFIHPETQGTIDRTGADKLRVDGDIIISRGDQWWYEGTFDGSTFGPYRGKAEPAFDGTGPSGPDRANYSEIFFITQDSSGSRNELGEKALGQTSIFNLDFDPADEIVVVGFAGINWDNFQSFQDPTTFAGYPNVHATATFSSIDGATTETQMAVTLSQQVADGNDTYFGFDAPAGLYLSNITLYQIGNNGRAIVGLDDLGLVQAGLDVTLWNGYVVDENSNVDTADFMGILHVANEPWVYSFDLGKYIYIPSDLGWTYIPQ